MVNLLSMFPPLPLFFSLFQYCVLQIPLQVLCPPKVACFAWQPPTTCSPHKGSLRVSSPRPYIPLSTPGQQDPSQSQPSSVPLAARSHLKDMVCPGALLTDSTLPCASSPSQHHSAATRTVDSKTVSSNPRHGPAGSKKVSSLYVPCLSNNIRRAASETSSGAARDLAKGTALEAAGTRAPAPSPVSCTAGTGKAPPAPPLDSPKLLLDICRDAGGERPSLGTQASFLDAVRPPVLGPQGTSDPENWRSQEPSLLQPCCPAKARKWECLCVSCPVSSETDQTGLFVCLRAALPPFSFLINVAVALIPSSSL